MTGDGSFSVHVNEYDQAMHSMSGAYNEALHKHVIPSGLLDSKKNEIHVLDVGFGLGYNILALMACCRNENIFDHVHLISLENEPAVVNIIKGIRFNDQRDELYQKIVHAVVHGEYSDVMFSIKVIFSDARETLERCDMPLFDAVFHDPFSPAKNPELWTVEFFELIYERVNPKAIITTYSAAPQVRRAMMDAGFIVGRGPSVGGKKEGTLATLAGGINSLPGKEIDEIKKDRKGTPYRDVTGADDRGTILLRRRNEMRDG